MRSDPYPKTAVLTPAQVKRLLGFRSRTDWEAFLASTPHFPAMRQFGVTRKKQPRMRYLKEQVYAFLALLGG